MKDIVKKIIVDFIERELPDVRERDINIPVDSGKIVSIVGARRTGKTFLIYSVINRLRMKIASNRILYINFEDDRLFPASLDTMNLILESYYELYPDNKSMKVYFFFDEVQEIDKWELFIRRIFDTENCGIFITGSSSKLLIKEVSSALRGRNLSYELFPLSFKEYLTFHDIDYRKYSSKSLTRIKNLFNQYLFKTSFPEIIKADDDIRRKVLNEYLDLIVYKDVVEKYGVSNIHLMKYLIKFLFSNSANMISINKIYNEMKSLGLSISRNSVYEYISYLEDSYTIFSLPLYTRNVREQQRNPRKFYALDNGLRLAMTISGDKGKLLESVVYLHLRRTTDKVYYYLSGKEVDFVTEISGDIQLLNVSYNLSSMATKKREIESLNRAMINTKKRTSLLLTADEEGEELIDNRKIKIVPVWKWFLEHNLES